MTFVPVMWSVWGFLVALTFALLVYRGNLQKDEEDQIFLDDSFEHEKAAQSAIIAKVNRIQPLLKVAKWLVAIASAFVVIYYCYDVYNQFK